MTCIKIGILLVIQHVAFISCQECTDRTPLGMSNGLINSSQIFAHSNFSRSASKYRARLYSPAGWCGANGAYKGDYKNQWFEVQFPNLTTINGIATQGQTMNGNNYIESFALYYSTDGSQWTLFENGGKVFMANDDNQKVKYNWFESSMVASGVRLFATKIKRHNDRTGQACMRMELYGCMSNITVLPLGMQSSMIKDDQLSNNAGGSGKNNARLFVSTPGLRGNGNPSYLQIDFAKSMTVTGVSLQGQLQKEVTRNEANFVKTYTLQHAMTNNNFTEVDQIFQGNVDFGDNTVYNTLPHPTAMKYLRITPTACNSQCEIKLEVYGYDTRKSYDNILVIGDFNAELKNPVLQVFMKTDSLHNYMDNKTCWKSTNECHQKLEYSSVITNNIVSAQNAYIDSPHAWCSNQSGAYIQIAFNKVFVISGIVLQGDSNSDEWVKEYKITYGLDPSFLKSQEGLVGNSDRIFPLSVNWLHTYIVGKYLRIHPTTCYRNGKCCMRYQIRGCDLVLGQPHSISAKQLPSSDINITWKAPAANPLPVDKYHIKVTVTKDYVPKTGPSFIEQTDIVKTFFLVENITIVAARVNITITADVQDVKNSTVHIFYIQPSQPPEPTITRTLTSETIGNVTKVTLGESSDVHGPISVYQIIISTSEMQNITDKLYSQEEAEERKLEYFLAATVDSEELSSTIQYNFVEGKEQVGGLNATLFTIGKYHIYSRAIIFGKDIIKYGFEDKNYYGLAAHTIVERNGLQKLVPEIMNKTVTSVKLVKGPPTLEYHFIVVMKVNKTSWFQKDPSSYNQSELKSYEQAGYNEPYITGILNAAQAANVKTFSLGDNATYTISTSSLRKRRSLTSYINGPLIPGETYIVFQRLQVQGKLYSSQWSKEFVEPIITTPESQQGSPSPINIELIAAIAAAVCVVIIIAIVIIICVRRRRNNITKNDVCDNRSSTTPMEMKDHPDIVVNANSYEETEEVISEESYYNTDEISMKPKFPPLPVADFPSFYLENKNEKNSDIVKQFKSVPMQLIHPCEVGSKPENKVRNRFANIIAYDHSRVVLQKVTGNESNDYINANHIENYSGRKEYIAAQGPKDETIFDFWRMILVEKPPAIIMLTMTFENGRTKCAQYWPVDNGKYSYDGIEVEVKDVQVYADYVLRKMKVNYENKIHHFLHLHFTSWPDHGCPEYPTLLINFCNRVRQLVPFGEGKQLVVHCSAGVGRTGSWIIIDTMLNLIKTQQFVDIYNYFESIRQSRVQLVQTVEQYEFVHSAVYEVLCCGDTGTTSSEFSGYLKKLLSAKQDRRYLMELEFERLNSVTVPFDDECYKAAKLKENGYKNRYPDILARDMFRLYLPQVNISTDYFNAVFVNGYKNKNGIVATQAPLTETINDFWVAVLERNVTTIIFLGDVEDDDVPQFWPAEDAEQFGSTNVKLMSSSQHGSITNRSFKISNEMHTGTLNKLQLSWPNHDIPDCDSVLKLIEELMKSQQSNGDGIILITCSDGANRCGTFIACLNALDQLKVEQYIDVFQTVRRMRLVRPEFVENLQQYQFIYTLVNKYLDSFATYSNFN